MNESSRNGEKTRERLMAAATTAFGATGFHGTNTRDIANAAGMSSAGVYVHYESKEDVLFQIMETGHRGVLAEIQSAVSRGETPVEQIAEFARVYALWHAEHHVRARVVNYELAALSPQHLVVIDGLRKQITKTVRAVIDAGCAEGLFSVNDPLLTTSSLLSHGIDVSRWYDEAGHITPERIAKHHVDVALRIVGATRPPFGTESDEAA